MLSIIVALVIAYFTIAYLAMGIIIWHVHRDKKRRGEQ